MDPQAVDAGDGCENIFGSSKTRSEALMTLDQALHTYQFAVAQNRRLALDRLWVAYDAWCATKDDWTQSIRNRNGAVQDLKDWLIGQEESFMPAAEGGWGGIANCYAYAMRCPRPAGNATPVPGKLAGAPALPYAPGWASEFAYYTGLMRGVEADAQATGVQVQVLSECANNAYPLPDNPPIAQAGATHYLVAMVVKRDGFHFLRRDSATGLWSHKNGAQDAAIETFASLTATGLPTPLTDAVAVALLRGDALAYRSSFAGYRFAGYIRVPVGGMRVSG